MKISPRALCVLLALFILPLAAYLRLRDINFIGPDDYTTGHWLLYIREHGIVTAYANRSYTYTPLYTYLLGIFNIFFPHPEALYVPKYIAFIGEGISAFWAWRILRLRYPGPSVVPLAGALALLLTPVFIDDSSRHGQCDSWLTAFLLPMLYCLMQKRPTAALLWYGLTVAFKPQAIFLFPCIMVCLLTRAIPWKSLWIIPAVYLLVCLPCWLEGRPFLDLLNIYPHYLAINHHHFYTAANIYYYLNEYNVRMAMTGMSATIALSCLCTWLTCKNNPGGDFTLPQWLLLATFFATLAPFLLPKMYDRYFYIAATLAFISAFLKPRWWLVAALLQCSFILASVMENTAWVYEWTHTPPRAIAMWLNTAALAQLFTLCYRNLWTKPQKNSIPVP